jgi:hypothetical protein
MPRSIRPSTSPKPAKPAKPDYMAFITVFSLVIALFLFLLQSDGVLEVNWRLSILSYLVLLAICLWSFLTHVYPYWKKFPQALGIMAITIFFGVIGAYATCLQYRREHAEHREPKRVNWLLPQIDMNHPYIVQFGGHYSKNGESGTPMIYSGSRSQIDSVQMGHKHGVEITVSNGQFEKWPAMMASVIGSHACIDVHIPTKRSPVDFKGGESGPLPDGWDWNSDATAMEIVDDQYRVIFQEEFIPVNQVIIWGYIQFENTTLVAYRDGWPSEVPHLLIGASDLRPMFLYPSNGENQGKRNPHYAP